jgi:hypothetical protein
MILTSKDIQDIENHPSVESNWMKWLRRIGMFLLKVPIFRRFIAGTKGGMLGRANRLISEEKYPSALRILHAGMNKCWKKKDPMAHYYWWNFMTNAVYCANMIDDFNEKDRLMAMAENGIKPFRGYHVAYCYCYFSRWMYYIDDFDAAVSYAEKAKSSDDSSAEAHFLLGWYILATGWGDGDPADHFKAAVQNDGEYLNIIAHDPVCTNYQDVMNRVTELSVVR